MLKGNLLSFFAGGTRSSEGHTWLQFSPHTNPTEYPKLTLHPLNDVGGWSLLLLLWMIVSSIFSLFTTYAVGYSLNMLQPSLYARYSNVIESERVFSCFLSGWGLFNSWLLFTKSSLFRMSFFWLFVSVPVLTVIFLNDLGSSGIEKEIYARGVLMAVISPLFNFAPLVYVFRSRRISLNCDSMIRFDDPFLDRFKHTPPKQGNRLGSSKTDHGVNQNKKTDTVISTVTESSQEAPNPNQGVYPERKPLTECSIDDLYGIGWSEIENDQVVKGLWARLFVENNGDEAKTKIAYLKARTTQLVEQQQAQI
jgi:hypothetical protein